MPRVIYIHSNGERTELEVAEGQSLMLAATSHDLQGIVGDCGGVMSCATSVSYTHLTLPTIYSV